MNIISTSMKPSRAYVLLLGLFVAVYVWRATHSLWIEPISTHISNFAITGGAVLLLIGPKDFERKKARNKVIQIALTFAGANIIVEMLSIGDLQLPGLTFLSFNTPDILDAAFGLLAILIVTFAYRKRAQ